MKSMAVMTADPSTTVKQKLNLQACTMNKIKGGKRMAPGIGISIPLQFFSFFGKDINFQYLKACKYIDLSQPEGKICHLAPHPHCHDVKSAVFSAFFTSSVIISITTTRWYVFIIKRYIHYHREGDGRDGTKARLYFVCCHSL